MTTTWNDPELQAAQERGDALFPRPEPEFRRDRNGFPIDTCRRCGGSGHYSFNYRDGTVCYGCSGSGLRHLVPKHHAAWRDAVRAAVRVVTQDLQPGDRVRPWGDRSPAAERTVRSIRVTDERCAWSTAPDGTETATGWWCEVEWDLADGSYETTSRAGGTHLWHRLGVRVDPAPYVAAAERGARYLRDRRG